MDFENNGSSGRRGLRRMMSDASASASNTKAQAGIDDELQEQHVQRQEQQRPAEQHRQQAQAGDRNVHGDDEAHGVTDIVVDAPAHAHGS